MKHKYEVIVGNIGTMDYTNKKLAKECYDTYVTLSKEGATRVSNEPVTLLRNGDVLEEYIPGPINPIVSMFNIDKIKGMIANCPKDETVILCPQWPINKPVYEYGNEEKEVLDLEELETLLCVSLCITDYNDLAADPHGILSND